MVLLIIKCCEPVVAGMVQTWYKQYQHCEKASLSPFNFPKQQGFIHLCSGLHCLIYDNSPSLSSCKDFYFIFVSSGQWAPNPNPNLCAEEHDLEGFVAPAWIHGKEKQG